MSSSRSHMLHFDIYSTRWAGEKFLRSRLPEIRLLFFWPGETPRAQSNNEEKNSPWILKDGPPIFISVAPELPERSNKTNQVFPAMKSTSPFLPQSAVSCKSESSSEVVAKNQMLGHT